MLKINRFGRVALILLALVLSGCSGFVADLTRTAAPVAVSSGLNELATPQSQANLKTVAASPAVQEAGYGVGLGIGRGFIDEEVAFFGGDTSAIGGEPKPAVGIAATTQPGGALSVGGASATTHPSGTAIVQTPTTQAATEPAAPATSQPAAPKGIAMLQNGLSPMVTSFVRTSVVEGMGQATTPEGLKQIHLTAETLGDGLMTGMSRAAERDTIPMLEKALAGKLKLDIDDDTRRRLGTILHDLLQQQVAPVIRDLVAQVAKDTLSASVRPENAPDVITNARNASVGAGLGTHDAMVDMGFLKPTGEWSMPLRLGIWGGTAMVTLIAIATLLLLVLRIMTAWSDWRGRRAVKR